MFGQSRIKYCTITTRISSASKIDIDFDISLLPEQIAAESVSEPNRGSDYVYDTFKANANSYLIQKVTYQLSNTNFLKFSESVYLQGFQGFY